MVETSIALLIIGFILFCMLIYMIDRYFSGPLYNGTKDNLSGKYAIITGGNSGIGKATAIQLARQGCSIIIGARDLIKSQQVAFQVKKITGKNLVEYYKLDLGDLQSIKNFVKEIKTNHIEYLINNGGVMGIQTRKITQSGFQMHCGINYVGHFYLTHLLWQKLNNANYFRVINVSSITHKRTLGFFHAPYINLKDINFEKDKYSPQLAYSRSKFYNILFTKSLAKIIEKGKGLSVAVHPGVVRTDVLRYYLPGWKNILMIIIHPIYRIFTKSSQQGAQTIIAMVNQNKQKIVNGGYYADCSQSQSSHQINQQKCKILWQNTQTDLGITFGSFRYQN